MPETEPLRPGKENAKKIEELEETIKVLLQAFKRFEKHYGTDFMPEGIYSGIEFN